VRRKITENFFSVFYSFQSCNKEKTFALAALISQANSKALLDATNHLPSVGFFCIVSPKTAVKSLLCFFTDWNSNGMRPTNRLAPGHSMLPIPSVFIAPRRGQRRA
jgi:hypothetical protein